MHDAEIDLLVGIDMAVAGTARWTWIWPALAWTILVVTLVLGGGGVIYSAAGAALFGTVFAAVYHAEMVAHRVGEPFGTLILALAVDGDRDGAHRLGHDRSASRKAGLARDTVFAAVMIVCNGIVGACLLMGGVRHREQGFQAQGASAALAVLVALTGLTMVLPNLAAQELGPLYNKPQLIFAGLVSLVLYFAFVFIQTVRHRDYFLPVKTSTPEEHAAPPDNRTTVLSAVLLVVSLVAIVGLAKALTPTVERGIDYLQVPKAVVGTIIAALVLLPEQWRPSRRLKGDRLQTSLNLALGSALATIGLTIPAVAAVSIVLGYRLELGGHQELGLLVLTLL